MLSFPASPFIVSLPFPEIIWSSELVPIRVSSESLPDMAKEKLLAESPLIPSVMSVVIVASSATSSATIAAVLLLFSPYKYCVVSSSAPPTSNMTSASAETVMASITPPVAVKAVTISAAVSISALFATSAI